MALSDFHSNIQVWKYLIKFIVNAPLSWRWNEVTRDTLSPVQSRVASYLHIASTQLQLNPPKFAKHLS
jgi:hypothetical protein